jgi:hypothetical protein
MLAGEEASIDGPTLFLGLAGSPDPNVFRLLAPREDAQSWKFVRPRPGWYVYRDARAPQRANGGPSWLDHNSTPLNRRGFSLGAMLPRQMPRLSGSGAFFGLFAVGHLHVDMRIVWYLARYRDIKNSDAGGRSTRPGIIKGPRPSYSGRRQVPDVQRHIRRRNQAVPVHRHRRRHTHQGPEDLRPAQSSQRHRLRRLRDREVPLPDPNDPNRPWP